MLEAVRVPRRPEHCRGWAHHDPQAPRDPVEKRNPSGGSAQWRQKRQGGNAAKGLPETRTLRKLEAHIAATQSLSEVLYVEAWGENGDKLAQKCQVGDVVSIQGAAVVSAPAQYSTSRLHYHLNLKGPLGLQVIVQKLDESPWQGIPAVHPLVPLSTISCPCGKVALTPVIAIECVECCGLQDTVDDVALTFRERNLTVWSNMSSLRQCGPSFPESDRFDAESSRSWLVCLTRRRKNCRKRDVAKSVFLFCTCCFDNQRHIRVLSFCGQVLFRFGERSVCGTTLLLSL